MADCEGDSVSAMAQAGFYDTAAETAPEDPAHEIAALREAVAARDAFLAIAAHELRNPMTPLLGRVQLTRRALEKGDVQKAAAGLEQVEWLITRFVKRATALLDISRATSGNLRLNLAEADLGVLVREIADSFAPVAEFVGSRLELQSPVQGPKRVCDRLAIEQIIDNLLSNALRHGAGRPIGLILAVDPDGRIVLTVADQGSGIAPESQERIFGRFERAVEAGQHQGGFGIGLWLVKQLVDLMQGAILIDSAPDRGARFTVILPLTPCEE